VTRLIDHRVCKASRECVATIHETTNTIHETPLYTRDDTNLDVDGLDVYP